MKNMFLGGNTPLGFISFYDEAFKNANRLFILKGGSGVGKHTFMKKCADYYAKKGFDVKYFRCSNDINSLDGIYIGTVNIAMIDGTSPHMVDPKIPGCFDEIIDLGAFLDTSKMETHKKEVLNFSQNKKKLYKRAYNFLKAAQILHLDTSDIIWDCINKDSANRIIKSIPKSIIQNDKDKLGNSCHIFASSYTSSGYVDYIGTLVSNKKTIGIKTYYVFNKKIMDSLYSYAISHGYDVIVCHSPIEPEKIDHLIFENFAVLSIDIYNRFSEVDELYNIKDIIDKDKLLDYDNQIKWNNQKFDELVSKAIETMNNCNNNHKKIEDLYIANMNFDGVNILFEKTIEKINRYI